MKTIKYTQFYISLLVVTVLFSCNALKTAPYDQYSYQKTIEIKVDASRLMDKATTPYNDHLEAIETLFTDIEKIVEYEKNKPNNEITFAMWKMLSDKEKNLLAGFFKRWQEQDSLSPVLVTEAKSQVLEAMDLLIEYEGKKEKESKDKLLSLILNN